MLFSANLLGIGFALVSALFGGSSDFIGGQLTRRTSPFSVLTLSTLSGLLTLVVCAVAWREPLPSLRNAGWAIAAGVVGVIGMTAFYRTLSLGYTASVASTAGVISAGLPVLFAGVVAGWPTPAQLAGFGLALAGIALASGSAAPGGGRVTRRGFLLACQAGTCFGLFFILLGQIGSGSVLWPVALVRCTSLLVLLILMAAQRLPLPGRAVTPAGLGIGVMDALGSALYVLARQLTRLDVAAVLVSLYPAVTVLLACVVVKEKVSPKQWLGVWLCLAAIALITV